jgi:hypothetical protein
MLRRLDRPAVWRVLVERIDLLVPNEGDDNEWIFGESIVEVARRESRLATLFGFVIPLESWKRAIGC